MVYYGQGYLNGIWMVFEWYLGLYVNNHCPTVQWYLNGPRGIMAIVFEWYVVCLCE